MLDNVLHFPRVHLRLPISLRCFLPVELGLELLKQVLNFSPLELDLPIEDSGDQLQVVAELLPDFLLQNLLVHGSDEVQLNCAVLVTDECLLMPICPVQL